MPARSSSRRRRPARSATRPSNSIRARQAAAGRYSREGRQAGDRQSACGRSGRRRGACQCARAERRSRKAADELQRGNETLRQETERGVRRHHHHTEPIKERDHEERITDFRRGRRCVADGMRLDAEARRSPRAGPQPTCRRCRRSRWRPQAASRELAAARSSLNAAEEALKKGDREDVNHYSYLASRQAQTGKARVEDAKPASRWRRREAERNRVLLDARTREAERATRCADGHGASSSGAGCRGECDAAEQRGAEADARGRTPWRPAPKRTTCRSSLEELQAKPTERGMVLTLE